MRGAGRREQEHQCCGPTLPLCCASRPPAPLACPAGSPPAVDHRRVEEEVVGHDQRAQRAHQHRDGAGGHRGDKQACNGGEPWGGIRAQGRELVGCTGHAGAAAGPGGKEGACSHAGPSFLFQLLLPCTQVHPSRFLPGLQEAQVPTPPTLPPPQHSSPLTARHAAGRDACLEEVDGHGHRLHPDDCAEERLQPAR